MDPLTKEDVWIQYYTRLRSLAHNTSRSTPASRKKRLVIIAERNDQLNRLQDKI